MDIEISRARLHNGGIGTLVDMLISEGIELNEVGVRLLSDTALVCLTDGQLQTVTDLAQEIIDGFAALTINATKITILADDLDETIITCAELASFDAKRVYGNIVEDESRINDGSIEFTAYSPGTYIFTIREIGGWRTGFIEIEAVEAV